MSEQISALILALLYVLVMVLWISALSESDGRCHADDCRHCPYAGGCPEEGKKNER